MKTVYFHIGYHRTGTTHVQSTVSKYRKELAARGCLLPETGYDGRTHGRLALCLPSKRDVQIQQLRCSSGVDYDVDAYVGPSPADLYSALAAEVGKAPVECALVSSECFLEWLNVNALRLQLQTSGINPEFIVFLRRQDRWIESVYSQVVKDPYLAYAGAFNDLPQHELLDYRTELKRWADCFGLDRLHVRLYEENAHPAATTLAMSQIMHVGSDWCAKAEGADKSTYENASLDECCVEVLRVLNARRAANVSMQNLIKQVSDRFSASGDFRKWRLPRAHATALMHRCQVGNDEMFDWLGLVPSPDWGSLPGSAYSDDALKRAKYRLLLAALRPMLGNRECSEIEVTLMG